MSTTFADLGVPAHLVRGLERRGIEAPFPIQTLSLPDALAGRDIFGRAPTGSGKTLAFGLTIAARLQPGAPRRPRALVLVPTRELASQVADEIELLSADRRSVIAVYGGASYGPQRRALAKGVATVVACPGRLEDLVATGDVVLDQVELVVLDEADRMADMGFLPAVRRLLDKTRPNRQTMLFSATLDSDVDAIVRRYQSDPARHEVESDEAAAGAVEHLFWRAENAQRVGLTADLVDLHGRAVVFCRTRHGADRLAKQLAGIGVSAKAIHGNRTQAQRERALAAFAAGKVGALVATDVAARGIHVDDVGCVIHFDPPGDHKDYVHRSGRTGRAGATGTVVSLVAQQHRKTARGLQRALGLPERLETPPAASPRQRVAVPTAQPTPKRKARPKRKPEAGGPAKPGRKPAQRRTSHNANSNSRRRRAGQQRGSAQARAQRSAPTNRRRSRAPRR